MKRFVLFLFFITIFSTNTLANGFQLSLFNGNKPEGQEVKGLRLSIVDGSTLNVKGFNFNIGGLSTINQFSGFDFGPLGVSKVVDDFKGVSLNIANIQTGTGKGLNLSFINEVEEFKGVNLGFVNYAKKSSSVNLGFMNYINNSTHLNFGLYNSSKVRSKVDIGLINYAPVTFLQIGLINATKDLEGLQIGAFNYAENGVVKLLPFINFKKKF